jgi:hypothetical protein
LENSNPLSREKVNFLFTPGFQPGVLEFGHFDPQKRTGLRVREADDLNLAQQFIAGNQCHK